MSVAMLQAHDRKLHMRALRERSGKAGDGSATYRKLKSCTLPTEEEATRPCGFSLRDWRLNPATLTVDIDGQQLAATPREFSTGSLGWNVTGKLCVDLWMDGEPVKVYVQVSGNMTVIRSKLDGAK